MRIITSIISILVMSHTGLAFQQEDERKNQVRQHSQKLADALESESLERTLASFDNKATLLPEYHKSLWGKLKIRAYYNQFFEKTKTIKFTKSPFEIMSLDDYYIELGEFEHSYITPTGNNFAYVGKYVTYWKFQKNQTPKIIAHIWGASHYFEPENLDFISIQVRDSKSISAVNQWEKDIEDIRKFAYKAVFAGDSKTQVETYANDAIYMTYYDSPFIGKEKITAYFDAHYNPDFPMDTLSTKSVKIIDMGKHALKFGEYYVGWVWEGKPQYIEGKGLTLYRRMEDESIKIYRQMINHSMPASPKN